MLQPAVHREGGAGDVVGVVGGEEGRCGSDVLRVPDPSGGDQGVAELGGVAGDVEVAGDLDQARTYGVDPDVAVGQLDGQFAGKGVYGSLGRSVGRVPRESCVAVDRGYVDDCSPPLSGMRGTALRAQKK